jgi:hypothetical protein
MAFFESALGELGPLGSSRCVDGAGYEKIVTLRDARITWNAREFAMPFALRRRSWLSERSQDEHISGGDTFESRIAPHTDALTTSSGSDAKARCNRLCVNVDPLDQMALRAPALLGISGASD